MIMSVSRRTDIPNYYSDWFMNRVKEGYVYVKNPMNPHQISKIVISPELVDCIIFWTKNPEPMMNRLDDLKAYPYYFQFTLTGYGSDVEMGIPDKNHMLTVFRTLSERIGYDKVVWRYDPIFVNDDYSVDAHLAIFAEFAEQLNGYTEKVIISFIDFYAKIKKKMNQMQVKPVTEREIVLIAEGMASIAAMNHMVIESCAETVDLQKYGIKHGSCIDKQMIESIIGYPIKGVKDKNQRKECGCLESVDIGTYHTCKNGCQYCYANLNEKKVESSIKLYDIHAPLLCGTVEADDKITERKLKMLRDD